MTTEQARMQALLDELPGPTPLSGEMVALLLPPARDDRKVFKLSAAMWKIVCIYIDASGGWAADSKSWAVFHAAIKYTEANFPENVPPGKLQAQTVMKHYHNCWTRPRVLDHGGRRAFIPPGGNDTRHRSSTRSHALSFGNEQSVAAAGDQRDFDDG